jgi:hypothetical protein
MLDDGLLRPDEFKPVLFDRHHSLSNHAGAWGGGAPEQYC